MNRRTRCTIAALCLLAMAGGAMAQTTSPGQTTTGQTTTGQTTAGQSTTTGPTTTTYRWVDSQGVVHYSDTAQPGAQVIHVPGAQTYHSPPARPTDPVDSPLTRAMQSAPRSCEISQPVAEASFFAPDSVAVSVSPALQQGDQLAVTLDGTPLGGGGSFQIQAPDRGAHTVSAMVRDAGGKLVCQSQVTFYVQRPSALSPTSPARGH